MAENSDTIERTIEILRVVFHNEENHYVIAYGTSDEFKKKNASDPKIVAKGFTVKGCFPEAPTPGTKYLVKGFAEKDAKRGDWFFKIKEATVTGDRSQDGWIEYLQREGPHIGPARAEELVKRFGGDAISKMAESASNLTDLDGITKERADELHVWAKNELHLSEVKSWLYRQGLTPALVSKIVIAHGHQTRRVVKDDTYLLTDIRGIGWKTADSIAQKIGLPKTNQRRIETGVIYAMQNLLDEGGHTCVFHDRLTRHAQEMLDVGKDHIIQACKSLVSQGKLCTQRTEITSVSTRPHLFEPNEGE